MITDCITTEEDYILTLRFQPMTLEDVATESLYTREEVRKIEAAALLAMGAHGFSLDDILGHYNPRMLERKRAAERGEPWDPNL